MTYSPILENWNIITNTLQIWAYCVACLHDRQVIVYFFQLKQYVKQDFQYQ